MVNPFEERLKSRKSNPFEKRLSERDKEETEEPEEERSFMQKVKDYFTQNKLGEAAAMQMQSGGFGAGGQSLTPESGEYLLEQSPKYLEGLTAGFYEAPKKEEETPGEKVIGEIFRLYGEANLIGGTQRVLKWLGISPKSWWGRTAETASIGGGLSGAKQIAKEGEIDLKEMAKETAIWGTVGLGLEVINAGMKFKQAVDFISENTGKSKPEVLSFLKDRLVTKFGEVPVADAEVLAKEALDAAEGEANALKNEIIEVEPIKEKPKAEEKFPSGLTKPKAVENPHVSKAIISPERQEKTIAAIDKEAAALAKEKVEKHLPIVKQIEEGFDFEGRFENGFSKVRKIAKKYNPEVDITDVGNFLSISRKKVGYFPKELLTPEQKKIIAEIKALRQHPQTQLKKLIDLFRLNNKKRSQIYETRHITGKQRDYVDFLTGLNKAIVKSMERTFPENSQWLNYFKNLNGEYSRYINAKKTLQMLENILQGNASQAHLNKFIVNPKMQKRLELSMGKEGAESLIQLIKDMKIARDAIKSIPTRKLKEMDAIYPLGLVIPGLKVPTAIAASRKIVEYGKRAFGWYLTTPESTEALDRAIRSLTRQDVSEYKKATDELKKNQSKNS